MLYYNYSNTILIYLIVLSFILFIILKNKFNKIFYVLFILFQLGLTITCIIFLLYTQKANEILAIHKENKNIGIIKIVNEINNNNPCIIKILENYDNNIGGFYDTTFNFFIIPTISIEEKNLLFYNYFKYQVRQNLSKEQEIALYENILTFLKDEESTFYSDYIFNDSSCVSFMYRYDFHEFKILNKIWNDSFEKLEMLSKDDLYHYFQDSIPMKQFKGKYMKFCHVGFTPDPFDYIPRKEYNKNILKFVLKNINYNSKNDLINFTKENIEIVFPDIFITFMQKYNERTNDILYKHMNFYDKLRDDKKEFFLKGITLILLAERQRKADFSNDTLILYIRDNIISNIEKDKDFNNFYILINKLIEYKYIITIEDKFIHYGYYRSDRYADVGAFKYEVICKFYNKKNVVENIIYGDADLPEEYKGYNTGRRPESKINNWIENILVNNNLKQYKIQNFLN